MNPILKLEIALGIAYKVPWVLWASSFAVNHDSKRTESGAVNHGPRLRGSLRSGEH